MDSYKVISSDDHVYEPSDLWTSRIGAKFGDRCPQVVREEGEDWWYCGGEKILGFEGGGEQLGWRFTAPEKLSRGGRTENVRPGAYLPGERVEDMDADGVEGEVIYPTVGVALSRVQDTELMNTICGAYNDWMAEFCNPFPNRLKGIAMLNLDSVDLAINEMERCAKLGLAGAMLPVYPPEEWGYDSPEYEPLWAAAQDLQMPLSLHINTRYLGGHGNRRGGPVPETAAFRANVDHWVRMSFSNMHRNGFISFQQDAAGVRASRPYRRGKPAVGLRLPSPGVHFPETQQILKSILEGCSEEEKSKIARENTARIYRFNGP